MESGIRRPDASAELWTPERCWILEVANEETDEAVSIARARVEPGVTTEWHSLQDTDERYLIVKGNGRMEIENLEAEHVVAGDVVQISANVGQRITNTGNGDLVFYCICTPRFRDEAYVERPDLGDG